MTGMIRPWLGMSIHPLIMSDLSTSDSVQSKYLSVQSKFLGLTTMVSNISIAILLDPGVPNWGLPDGAVASDNACPAYHAAWPMSKRYCL